MNVVESLPTFLVALPALLMHQVLAMLTLMVGDAMAALVSPAHIFVPFTALLSHPSASLIKAKLIWLYASAVFILFCCCKCCNQLSHHCLGVLGRNCKWCICATCVPCLLYSVAPVNQRDANLADTVAHTRVCRADATWKDTARQPCLLHSFFSDRFVPSMV